MSENGISPDARRVVRVELHVFAFPMRNVGRSGTELTDLPGEDTNRTRIAVEIETADGARGCYAGGNETMIGQAKIAAKLLLGRDALARAAFAERGLKCRQAAAAVGFAQALAELVRLLVAPAGERHADPNHVLLVDEDAEAVGQQLAKAVASMEGEVRRVFKTLPDPIKVKLQPLFQRVPEDPANTKVSVAERFQNVLGILNEVNKANNEITVNYEVHQLADGKPSEVRVIYVGLAQAYYLSAGGEAGIGRPSADGWKWEPSKAVAADVLVALDILQGKHSPAFVPLPVSIK